MVPTRVPMVPIAIMPADFTVVPGMVPALPGRCLGSRVHVLDRGLAARASGLERNASVLLPSSKPTLRLGAPYAEPASTSSSLKLPISVSSRWLGI